MGSTNRRNFSPPGSRGAEKIASKVFSFFVNNSESWPPSGKFFCTVITFHGGYPRTAWRRCATPCGLPSSTFISSRRPAYWRKFDPSRYIYLKPRPCSRLFSKKSGVGNSSATLRFDTPSHFAWSESRGGSVHAPPGLARRSPGG